MMSNEKFNLNWNDFGSSTVNTFKDLLTDEDFTDVTLACDDDKQIKAHKAILSASSPFFKRILKMNPHQHPLVYLKGINQQSLQAIIHFIYLGETEVEQEDLDVFMAAAKELEIGGLTENNTEHLSKSMYNVENKNRQGEVFSLGKKFLAQEVSAESFEMDVQTGQASFDDFGLVSTDSNIQENYSSAIDNRRNIAGKYPCDSCEYKATDYWNLKSHIKAMHEGIKFDCDSCEKKFSNKSNLIRHNKSITCSNLIVVLK